MKFILTLLMVMTTGNLMAGKTCVFQVYKSSFTTEQWETIKTKAQAKVANMSQPIQKFRVFKRLGGLVIMGDCSIKNLVTIKDAETSGKIRYIGLYHYTKRGYDRKHPDWPILKQFFYEISKSTWSVEVSTPTP